MLGQVGQENKEFSISNSLITNDLYNSIEEGMLDKINWKKVKKLFNELDNKIIYKIFVEKKPYREIAKTLKRDGFNITHQTVSNRLKNIIKLLDKNLKKIFTK